MGLAMDLRPRGWTTLITLLVFAMSSTACSDFFNDDPEDPLAGEDWDRSAPSVSTDGQWQPLDGPPMSRKLASAQTPSLLGVVDDTLFVVQEGGELQRIVRVDLTTGDWQVDGELDDVLLGAPRGLIEFDGTLYANSTESTVRRDASGEWEALPYVFQSTFEFEDVLIAHASSVFGEANNALFRREAGGDWEQIHEHVNSVVRTGDVLHVDRRNGSNMYSRDRGETWQEYSSHAVSFFTGTGVKFDGRYWSPGRYGGQIWLSDDAIEWEREDFDTLEGAIASLTTHQGGLYAIERSEDIHYVTGADYIISWIDEAWTRLEAPPHTRLMRLESVDDILYVETRSAGIWRSSDGAQTWEPVGPPLYSPGYIAENEHGMCAIETLFGVASCRSDVDSPWWRDGIDPQRRIKELIHDRDDFFIRVEFKEDSSSFSSRTELWRMDAHGDFEQIAEADALASSQVTTAFDFRGDVHFLLRNGGLFRLDQQAQESHEVVGSVFGSSSAYFDATAMHDSMWLIEKRGDYADIYKVGEDGQRDEVSQGLPEQGPDAGYRRPIPVAFERTADDLYVLVSGARPHPDEDGPLLLSFVYRWSEQLERWVETPAPGPNELDGERFRVLRGSSTALYAATDTGVYQFNPAENAWADISQGLSDPIRQFSLSAYDDRVYVGVEGQGVWEYVEDIDGE